MRDALAALNHDLKSTWDVQLTSRTAVNTGEVIAGDHRRGHQFVSGEAVTLDDPARRNILSAELITELTAAFDDLEQREDVSAVVLTGGGRAFCAGADLADLLAAADGDPTGVRRVYAGFDRVRRSSLVTIAAVNGPAVGAGLNLALVLEVGLSTRGRIALLPRASSKRSRQYSSVSPDQ